MFSLFLFGSLFADSFSALLRIRQRSLMLGDFVKKTILTKIEPAEKPAQPLTKSDEESG